MPSEQRGGFKEVEEITSFGGGGGLPPPICYGNVITGSSYGLMMKRDMGTFYILMPNPGVRLSFCCSYLSICKGSRDPLCPVFSLNSVKAAIQMLIQHALFIILHLHISTEIELSPCYLYDLDSFYSATLE